MDPTTTTGSYTTALDERLAAYMRERTVGGAQADRLYYNEFQDNFQYAGNNLCREITMPSFSRTSNIMETQGSEKISIRNTGNLKGELIFHPGTNELRIMNEDGTEFVKISLNLDQDNNPRSISINDRKYQEEEIDDTTRKNLNDSSVHYSTGTDELNKLI